MDDESTMTSWEQFWQKTLTVDPKIGQKDGKGQESQPLFTSVQ
jgi:hypothetical protein